MHSAAPGPGRWQDVLIAAGGLLLAVDVAALLTRAGGLRVTSGLDGTTYLLLAVCAAVMTLARARRPGAGERLGWLVMSAGSLLFLCGVLIATCQVVVLNQPYVFPSLSDAAYLPAELAWTAAVLLLAETTMATERLRLLLDGAVVATSMGYLSWTWVMQPLYESTPGELTVAVALTYPIVNVVQTVIVLSVLSHSRRLSASMLLIGLAMVLIGISTIVFATHGNSHPSDYDALDLAAFVAIMLAARVRRPPPAVPADAQPSTWQILLPYAPLVVVAPAALDNVFRTPALDPVSRLLLSGLAATVILRQVAVVLEARSLAASLARTSAEQRLLIEQAPVGICRLDRQRRIISANRYLETMLAVSARRLTGRPIFEVLAGSPLPAAGTPGDDQVLTRLARPDGTSLWCSTTVGTIRGASGRVESSVAIVENVTERMQQVARAADIQRGLLPDSVPDVAGYEVAGACRAAQDVAGDLYDWAVAADGRLDLTLADVMGKGLPAAMVMAILRTALRSAGAGLGPAERTRLAAEAIGRGVSRDGLFVTMLEMSLDPATGTLRYVDAGHGLCAMRRRDGDLVGLPVRSLPLGVRDDEVFVEGTIRLLPGEALIAYSDGLVERPDRTIPLHEFDAELAAAAGAADAVRRLMERMPQRPADDVTILVLRRL